MSSHRGSEIFTPLTQDVSLSKSGETKSSFLYELIEIDNAEFGKIYLQNT